MSKKKHKKHNGTAKPAPVESAKETVVPVNEPTPEATEKISTADTENAAAEAAKEASAVNAVEELKGEGSSQERSDAVPVNTDSDSTVSEEKTGKKKKVKEHGVEITKIQVISEEIIEALDEALDGNAEELDHPESNDLQAAKKISLRRVATAIFGFLMTAFAVIGIMASVNYIADYIDAKNDDTALREEFLRTVAPLTASDSSIFESTDTITEEMLITCAGWDIILNPQGYIEENDSYTVSQLDIDKRIASMFGTELSYTHKTVGDEELGFIYDEETGMYTIPAYPQSPAYIPVLSGYEAIDGGYKVEVAYRLPITTIIEGNINAEKIMIYTLKSSDSGFIISSLEISELITGEEL